MNALEIIFWVCAGLVVYAYAVYPAAIWMLSRLFGGTAEAQSMGDGELPFVTLLICAHNEEAVIGRRLENALGMDYPREGLRVVVASDGSSDATAAVVRTFAGRGVTLLEYGERRGKAAVLNAAMAEVDGELVLLSDANTEIDGGAARRLVRWFADPKVGAVCGRLVLTDRETGRNVDSLYWKYETFLKKCEGRLGALLGSNGAIYAIRRGLYVPIPSDTIVDDFVIPLLAKVRSGCGIVYDCSAVAREESAADIGAEFRRRARIGAGGFQAIGLLWRLLDPRRGWVAFTFLSHKILRWLCPFFLVGMLASSVFLWKEPFYRWAVLGQVGFYLLSVVLNATPGRVRVLRPLRLAPMFTSMNAALLVGFWRWLRGTQKGTWERTVRLVEVEGVVS